MFTFYRYLLSDGTKRDETITKYESVDENGVVNSEDHKITGAYTVVDDIQKTKYTNTYWADVSGSHDSRMDEVYEEA